MKAPAAPTDLFSAWEGAVAFRLFAERENPTLTVSEQIAARLGDRILSGAMTPGSRIGEQQLADEFGVSRGPIRDALRILEREGLATILPRRGAIVTELDGRELRELMEIRAGLFEIVTRKLANERRPEALALMRAGVARLESLAAKPGGGDAYAETTYRLLILCARFTDNRRLQRMVTALSLQTLRYSKLGLASIARRQQSAALWREATQAFERGDVDRMVLLTRQRIDESGDEAIRRLEAAPAPGERQ